MQSSALNKVTEDAPPQAEGAAAESKAASKASKAESKPASKVGSQVGSRIGSIKVGQADVEACEVKTDLHAKMTNAFTRSATRSVKNIQYSSVDVDEQRPKSTTKSQATRFSEKILAAANSVKSLAEVSAEKQRPDTAVRMRQSNQLLG